MASGEHGLIGRLVDLRPTPLARERAVVFDRYSDNIWTEPSDGDERCDGHRFMEYRETS